MTFRWFKISSTGAYWFDVRLLTLKWFGTDSLGTFFVITARQRRQDGWILCELRTRLSIGSSTTSINRCADSRIKKEVKIGILTADGKARFISELLEHELGGLNRPMTAPSAGASPVGSGPGAAAPAAPVGSGPGVAAGAEKNP
jgi:hypothetical protein